MSRITDSVSRARTMAGLMIRSVTTGTAARPQTMTLLDFAMQHAEDWGADQPPMSEPGPERGGSSSPREVNDRREMAAVKRRASEAATRLPKHARQVEKLIDEMYRDVMFLTQITDDDPDNTEDALPGCKSCARAGVTTGIHTKESGLCRWCLTYSSPTGDLPPVQAVEIRHRESARMASFWMAKNAPKNVMVQCVATKGKGEVEFVCSLAQDHPGDHDWREVARRQEVA